MVRLRDTVERAMFYGAKPIIFERARELRKNQTVPEKKLWTILCKKQIMGMRFRRQHPINIFIADFYCHTLKLVVEIDGSDHRRKENKEYDENRTAEMNRFGISVLRFTNDEVTGNLDNIRKRIEQECIRLHK